MQITRRPHGQSYRVIYAHGEHNPEFPEAGAQRVGVKAVDGEQAAALVHKATGARILGVERQDREA